MKTDKLKAMGDIAPEYVNSAAELKKKRRPFIGAAVAAAALIAVGLSAFLAARALRKDDTGEKTASSDPTTRPTETVSEAPTEAPSPAPAWPAFTPQPLDVPMIVPTMTLPDGVSASFASVPDTPNYPSSKFFDYRRMLASSAFYAGSSLTGFYNATTAQFLLSGEKDQNAVYSPLNVYMALAMAAETADGETREQLLDLLGAPDIGSLREQANKLFISNYFDNKALISLPAASLWIDNGACPYIKENTLKTLGEIYHASSFTGEMGDPEFTKLYRDWLNEQTHDLLKDQVNELELNSEDLMHILTTLYFKTSWANKFIEGTNTVETFRSPTGDEQVTFMHGGAESYYELNGFTMVHKGLNENTGVWFVLPDKGVSLEDVVKNGEALNAILTDPYDAQVQGAVVHLHMPKVDVESTLDLEKGLKNLGVTDCFDPSGANFSPLTDLEGVYISSVTHGARVIMNEDGVEAAAYTDIGYAGAAEPLRIVEFTLDRPFMFVITGMDGTPLFVGTVYHPGA